MSDEIIIEPNIHSIPDVNFASFEQRFNRLAKRAVKLGSGEITMQQVGHEDWPAYRNLNTGKVTYFPPTKVVGFMDYESLNYYRRYHQVVVTGSSPKLNGWEFIGSLELMFDEAGNKLGQMVRTVPDKEMPVEFRDAAVWCSHCNANRGWHSTFVVKHEDGTYKQVGRNCLRDFTGHNSPESIANYAEILLSLTDLADCAEDEDWGFGGGGGTRLYDVETLLTRTSAIVRKDGWHSKGNSEFPTADTLLGYMLEETDKYEKRYPVEEIDTTTAEQALAFMLALADKPNASDYEYNLSLMGRAGKVGIKSFGFLASGIAAYNRAHDREMAQKREATISEFVGATKDRMELTLTLARVNYFETQYGSMAILKFYDASGNVIVWKTGSDPRIEIGTTIKAKATIGEHKEYKGVKQTEVKRLTVIETVGAKKEEMVAA
jgi:hypothetical protein